MTGGMALLVRVFAQKVFFLLLKNKFGERLLATNNLMPFPGLIMQLHLVNNFGNLLQPSITAVMIKLSSNIYFHSGIFLFSILNPVWLGGEGGR